MDFNQKSPLMRCKDIDAHESFRILTKTVFDINDHEYATVLENDLYQLMNEQHIENIIPFF